MKTSSINILAIVPGSRYLGIAIFSDSDLREWCIKSLKRNTAKEKIEQSKKIIGDLLNNFSIDILATKKLHPSRCSTNLSKIMSAVKQLRQEFKIEITEYSIQTIERNLISGKCNKNRLMEEITSLFPILYNEYEREKRNKNKYLTRMFEAIALGYFSFTQYDSKRKKVGTKNNNYFL